MEIIITSILIYLTIAVIYNAFFVLGSMLKSDSKEIKTLGQNRILVMIPAYKEDSIIFETAEKALYQNYESHLYDVAVIADSLQPKTIEKLKTLDIKLLEVSFEKSTKAKAINKAYELIDTTYDITLILDSDNIMEPDFLNKINTAFNLGSKAAQAHRVAKNQESKMAVLDAISEEINNNIYRKGHQNFGFASALIGSGMAFEFHLFKTKMANINAIGGFDKELELSLLKEGINIQYLEDALVYDEKVAKEEVFTNQRTRWIAAQIRYGIGSFPDAFFHLLFRGNVNYFDKSLQFLLPPRLILLGILVLMSLTCLLVSPLSTAWSFGLLAGYVAALALATPKKFFTKETLKACLLLPKTFLLMIVALKGFKKAKTNFLHTPHQSLQS